MSYETITLTKENRLAILTLNRPTSMNAMNDVMMKELADCFEVLKGDNSVQVLILKGEGRAFSAGGDIKQMIDPNSPMDIESVMVDITRLAKAFYTLPQITIASVHGAAAGLGFSIVLACDYIIAEENSKLAMNFIGIGLVPDGAGHFFMKERVGVPQAKKLIWSGRVMDGNEALSMSLVDEVVSAGEAASKSEQFAAKLLHSPIAAMLESKEILHSQKLDELSNVLQMESIAQAKMRKSADHLEGIQAFVEKRKPVFASKDN